jgi:hypothetical protein
MRLLQWNTRWGDNNGDGRDDPFDVGGRVSLMVGFVVILLEVSLGILVGGISVILAALSIRRSCVLWICSTAFPLAMGVDFWFCNGCVGSSTHVRIFC